MRYLITMKEHTPFLTKWFEHENHFDADLDMIVYDLDKNKFTTDGVNWNDIEIYHL